MAEHLIRKLENYVSLGADEKAALRRLAERAVTTLDARQDLYLEGDQPERMHLVLEGYACRYKLLEDGRRQIVGLFLPGDLCDARMFILRRMDHSVGALTPLRVAQIDQHVFLDVADTSPRLTRALWWNALVEESISREWLTSLGQRSAYERIAHLLCEFFLRSRAVALVNGYSCQMPLTQLQLADSTGLTAVHVNRTLKALDADGLFTINDRVLHVHDLDRLMNAAMFNINYLHLSQEGGPLDTNDP